MKDFLTELADSVRQAVGAHHERGESRRVFGDSPGGDAQFDIDEIAEQVAWDFVLANAPVPLAVYTEDGSLRTTGPDPRRVLVIDPIDGTRPTSADLEMGTVSVATAPYLAERPPTIGDVDAALVLEIKSGAWLYADATNSLVTSGYSHPVPRLSATTDLDQMFWSVEFNGHPMELMSRAYAHLVNASANTGGVFVFNSASFSITRLVTGQLDAYVDIGNRLLRDHPDTTEAFLRAGRGNILHLFPYDIAASVLIARVAGVTITDAYGGSLDDTLLLDLSPGNQRSCVAASNPRLHAALLAAVNWDLRD